MKKLLLASNSTYVEKILDATENTPFALPSERSMTEREMLTTPGDEIKSITGAILDILAGNELDDSSSFSTSRRNVRSFAPAGTSKLAEMSRIAPVIDLISALGPRDSNLSTLLVSSSPIVLNATQKH